MWPVHLLNVFLVVWGAPAESPRWKPEDFLPPEACQSCHPQHYEEWSGSMHAYAISDPVFHAMHALGQKETAGQLGDFCIRCHAPVGSGTGEINGRTKGIEGLSPGARSGVSCEVCHRGVKLQEGHPANANLKIVPGAAMVGGLPDPVANNVHASETSDVLRNPGFCGSCHNVVSQRGVPVEKPHTEYVSSVYPDRRLGCIDCHMQTYSGRATPDGPLRSRLHRHDFVGVDVALTPFPRRGLQRQQVEAFLRTAARMSVEAPDKVEAGHPFTVTVRVKNSGAGHNLPTGPSTERQMWIAVNVRTDDGRVVFRSGYLDRDGDLCDDHSRHAPGADDQLALFTDRFVDKEGNEVYFMWRADKLEEGTIPPLETRTARYRIDVPPGSAGKRLHLEVRLRFRAFPPHQLRRLGIFDLRDRLPIFDMNSYKAPPIEVVSSLRPRGVLRVPEDFESPRAALDAARSGEEIIVQAGTYLLDSPLDFRGRDVVLRSRDGAANTVLELATDLLDEERACLVLFRGGESPAARLEGFTLRRGRGLFLDGVRVGGAVVCLESDPTLVDNVFVANEAASGAGGAIFLRGSRAALLGNTFQENRAGFRGGAVCAVEGSAPIIENNSLVANSAPEGGALALEEGADLFANSLRANWAFRGGGVALHGRTSPAEGSQGDTTATGEPSLLKGNFVSGNSAESGGGIFLAGTTRTRLERNVVAGNLGGGLHLEGGALVDAPHSTVVYNLLGGGALTLEPGCRIRFTNSILWGNRPNRLSGEVTYSLVDDPAYAEKNNQQALPLFWSESSRWERCIGREDSCVPVVRGSLEPENPRRYRRFVPGNYRLRLTSPCIDAGDPRTLPDPDGTRPDLGAIHRPKHRNLFVRGDLTGDGAVHLEDVLALWKALLAAAPLPCPDAADLDDDGRLAPLDAILSLGYLLGLGPPPEPPFPDCGVDGSAADTLGCFEDRCKLN